MASHWANQNRAPPAPGSQPSITKPAAAHKPLPSGPLELVQRGTRPFPAPPQRLSFVIASVSAAQLHARRSCVSAPSHTRPPASVAGPAAGEPPVSPRSLSIYDTPQDLALQIRQLLKENQNLKLQARISPAIRAAGPRSAKLLV
jgi:hypothetical protein